MDGVSNEEWLWSNCIDNIVHENRIIAAAQFTFSPGMKRVSFSTTSRSATPALRIERVRPPGPGPTSHTWAFFKLPAWRTILSEKIDGWRNEEFLNAVQSRWLYLTHASWKLHNSLCSSGLWIFKLRLIVCDTAICVYLCVMNMRCINLRSHLVQGQAGRSDLHCINYVKT